MPAHQFIWYELRTSDVDAARAFYGDVLGWRARERQDGGARSVAVGTEHGDVAGITPIEEADRAPHWLGYVATADAEGAVKRISAGGGTIHRHPWTVDGVGRLAIAADPQGATFALLQDQTGQPRRAFDPQHSGHCGWNELLTIDPAAALGFYAGQFGWSAGPAIPMGPLGTYQIVEADGVALGGLFRRDRARPAWLFYFGVPSVSASIGRIRSAGGQIVLGATKVPGGSIIAQAIDPQGAAFAVVERA